MKKSLFVLSLFFSVASQAAPVFSLPQVARDVLGETFGRLQAVGVLRLNPYHPSLPYPQVSAIEAFYNPRTQALAYYDEEYVVGGVTAVFKNWQGGNRHRVSYNEEHIEFVTPFLGQVAHANRFKTVSGWQYRFYCRSQPVDKMNWDKCIRFHFVSVIVQQMARGTF